MAARVAAWPRATAAVSVPGQLDAADTGLPIVGLGPMTHDAEVEVLRAALKF